jgi:two-component system, sensor histidine kinase and response regulator
MFGRSLLFYVMKLILLIDDDEGIRFSFGETLRSRGHRVIEADSGEAGLELAREQMPDLILTDINMPGGDGQMLLQHIRADPELRGTQVVLMTGRPDRVPARKGMEQGADDFLAKPITAEALFSCVEARLNRADVHWRVEDRVFSNLESYMSSQLPHEFITPLAGILGLSEILLSDFSSLSTDEMKDFHDGIHRSALRLQRTVKNYLLILQLEQESKIRVGTELLSHAKLQTLLKTGVDSALEREDRRADITLRSEKCSIWVQPSDLTQIVEELVDNAFKFSRLGTAVEVRLGGNGVLLVTDAGRGMSEEEISQIGAFRQFNRDKHEQQGLGLGLTLVQKLAPRNGARFSVESKPGQGVQIRIEFSSSGSAN